ncbi:MAG: EAL domain-containing response regulator [Bradyrhizobiaceae bacterium]|nr:EAL domain-containing response regulator [Bradyrhizobiaceae bacterium]
MDRQWRAPATGDAVTAYGPGASVPSASAPDRSAAHASPLCYIVDDEVGIRQIISYRLHEFGFRTREFEGAPTVLAALKQEAPDLFFLDVSLRGSDAIDVIRGLAAHNFQGAVQIMSGKDPALLEEIRRVGERHSLRMLPVLRKPFRAEALRRIAGEYFSERATETAPAAALTAETSLPEVRFNLDEILRMNWLRIWYQPKIQLARRSLVGAEGLVRAAHPQHGILPPGAFLPNASEESMLRLTEVVLLGALRDWQYFADHGFALKLALNVPVSAFIRLPIPTIVRENRPKSEKWPGLVLEVTEDQIVRDIPLAHEIATQLKIYDIDLAIDDFGTGYSHLARLRELPFAELKLDRKLVENCGEDPTNAALCQTSIELAHRFGTKAVAEGIEKTSELDMLVKLGCDMGQGFLFAPPMQKERFISLLKQRTPRRAAENNVA